MRGPLGGLHFRGEFNVKWSRCPDISCHWALWPRSTADSNPATLVAIPTRRWRGAGWRVMARLLSVSGDSLGRIRTHNAGVAGSSPAPPIPFPVTSQKQLEVERPLQATRTDASGADAAGAKNRGVRPPVRTCMKQPDPPHSCGSVPGISSRSPTKHRANTDDPEPHRRPTYLEHPPPLARTFPSGLHGMRWRR